MGPGRAISELQPGLCLWVGREAAFRSQAHPETKRGVCYLVCVRLPLRIDTKKNPPPPPQPLFSLSLIEQPLNWGKKRQASEHSFLKYIIVF
jgi:hypothetical protein